LLAYQQLNDDYELMVFEDPDESHIINNVVPDLEVRDLLYEQALSKRTNLIKTSNGEYLHIEQAIKILTPYREVISKNRSQRYIIAKHIPGMNNIPQTHNIKPFIYIAIKNNVKNSYLYRIRL